MIPGCYKCRRFSTDECPHDNEECTRFNACDLYEEQGVNVAKPNACPQLYEVRADVRELLKSIDEYHEAFSVSELEHFSRQKLDAGVKMMRLKNKVSEHFV